MLVSNFINQVEEDIHLANDNEHVSVRIYKTLYGLIRQFEMQNANLEFLKSEIKESVVGDDETFLIMNDLFTKLDSIKNYTEDLIN